MNRLIIIIAVSLLLIGCNRYGTRANGPFARKQKSNPTAAIPAGPAANNSPLALGNIAQPEPPPPPGPDLVVPLRPNGLARGSDEVPPPPAGDVIPAGGFPPDDPNAFPPKRRPEPQPGQLPSPFAPKDATTPQPKQPAVDPAQAAFARNISEIKKILAIAIEKWNQIDTYEATVTRRELAPSGKTNDEVVFYQFRREPMSVYLRTISDSSKGREVLYNPGKYGDKIYAIIGQGDGNLLYKTGDKAPAMSPDSPLVKDKTRYSVREAGFGAPINRMGEWVTKAAAGKFPIDSMTYLGLVQRPEFATPLAGVQLKLRAGEDPLLPNGGVRHWYYDQDANSPTYGLPLLIVATEPNGKEVEYYLFEKLKFGTKYPDSDFSPDRFNKKR